MALTEEGDSQLDGQTGGGSELRQWTVRLKGRQSQTDRTDGQTAELGGQLVATVMQWLDMWTGRGVVDR